MKKNLSLSPGTITVLQFIPATGIEFSALLTKTTPLFPHANAHNDPVVFNLIELMDMGLVSHRNVDGASIYFDASTPETLKKWDKWRDLQSGGMNKY